MQDHLLTAAGALEAEPCSRGALRWGCLARALPAWLRLVAGACSRVRFEGEGSVFIRRRQAGCQEWGAGHNGAPRHVSIELLILATDTEDNSRPGTALHECRPDTVALFVRAEWEREPPQSWGPLIRPIDNAIFFWRWGPKDRHRDLACGNRKQNLIVSRQPWPPEQTLLCQATTHSLWASIGTSPSLRNHSRAQGSQISFLAYIFDCTLSSRVISSHITDCGIAYPPAGQDSDGRWSAWSHMQAMQSMCYLSVSIQSVFTRIHDPRGSNHPHPKVDTSV